MDLFFFFPVLDLFSLFDWDVLLIKGAWCAIEVVRAKEMLDVVANGPDDGKFIRIVVHVIKGMVTERVNGMVGGVVEGMVNGVSNGMIKGVTNDIFKSP